MTKAAMIELAGLGVFTIVKWLVFTGVLWGMIKIQKLNYNLAGLFGSALLATLVNYVPFFGGYLSWAVLVLCLWKCTGADIMPDVFFTVAVAGALMFAINLFAFGALMPDLHTMRETVSEVTGTDRDEEATAKTDDATTGPSFLSGLTGFAERTFVAATNRGEGPAMTVAARTSEPKPSPLLAKLTPGALVVKGISPHFARPSVMIGVGREVHTLMVGDSFAATLPKGRVHLRCEEITPTNVTFSLADETRVVLHVGNPKSSPGR